MIIQESHINRTENYTMCEDYTTLADTYMGEDASIGDIYRACIKEHGRCASKVYIDTPDGVKAVGWVFEKLDRYEDTGEKFLHETWITLLDKPDTVTQNYHYMETVKI